MSDEIETWDETRIWEHTDRDDDRTYLRRAGVDGWAIGSATIALGATSLVWVDRAALAGLRDAITRELTESTVDGA